MLQPSDKIIVLAELTVEWSVDIVRIHCYKFPQATSEEVLKEYGINDSDYTLSGIALSEVKKLMKKYGGVGYTMHLERDGTLFETTPITLKGNNSRFKYNQHL